MKKLILATLIALLTFSGYAEDLYYRSTPRFIVNGVEKQSTSSSPSIFLIRWCDGGSNLEQYCKDSDHRFSKTGWIGPTYFHYVRTDDNGNYVFNSGIPGAPAVADFTIIISEDRSTMVYNTVDFYTGLTTSSYFTLDN